ncbi:unnamed protein product [Lymnaea stagnalis]|uniref:MIB/HERC2 domain-containing protein n=1 Tax=Lymnaea stagnalis TaxID=6523 RepID=A0AAV2IEI8_LYMST
MTCTLKGSLTMNIGLRVVRGPDWAYGDQDGCDGLVGTVVEIGGTRQSTAPEDSVGVVWDSGVKGYYKVGYENAYDLCTYANVQRGVVHFSIDCNFCGERGLAGFKWMCQLCSDVELCTPCYMSDKHNTLHTFIRCETRSSYGVKVPARHYSQADKRLAVGVFKGAYVVRGPDWSGGHEDGGAGNIGEVININKSGEYSVRWNSGGTYIYHMGPEGKVDLRFVAPGYGGFYYKSHLPAVGKLYDETMVGDCVQELCLSTPGSVLSVKLTTSNNEESVLKFDVPGLKREIKDVGNIFVGKPAAIDRPELTQRAILPLTRFRPELTQPAILPLTRFRPELTQRPINFAYVKVETESRNACRSEHRANSDLKARGKATRFKVGDHVKIGVEFSELKTLQREHGEIQRKMIQHFSKVGTVFDILGDGDIMVKFGDNGPFIFNPAALTKHKTICRRVQ